MSFSFYLYVRKIQSSLKYLLVFWEMLFYVNLFLVMIEVNLLTLADANKFSVLVVKML